MAVDSACSIGVSVLKFLSLPVRYRYDTLLVIELHLLSLKLVRIIARGIRIITFNFDVSRTFRSRLMSQHLSDAH